MNKAAIASLLVTSALVPASRAFAQTPAAPTGQVQMEAPEFADYDAAIKQTTPAAQAPALEAYLAKYPKSTVKNDTLQRIMLDYSSVDLGKAAAAADNYLQVNPTNIQAFIIEVAYHNGKATTAGVDPATKQTELDTAASFAQKGLDAMKGSKPADLTDDQFTAIKGFAVPTFYSAIGGADLNKKDGPGAIAAYSAELAAIKPDQLSQPGSLQEAYYLAQAYYISTPPDYVNCTFYATRAAALAPAQFKPQLQPLADYCFKKRHGANKDGYDAVVAAATATPTPQAGFADLIPPAPTDADQANQLMKTTADADIAKLATGDKEYVLQYGSDENKAKVWDSVKGKSVEIPGALVIESSPTVIKVAVSDGAVQDKKADFTFNLKPLEEPAEPKAKTPAALAAYKKEKAAYDKATTDDAAATAVGKTVTLSGTYSSYTPTPIMIIMDDGAIILTKAAPAKTAAPAHRPAHK